MMGRQFSGILLRLLPVIMALLIPLTVLGETVRNLSRTADPLEIPGDSLPGILGAPLESIYISALREGKWTRVPFQIDERRRVRTESGETTLDYVFAEGTSPMVDDDPTFDADDLLVFLARDLGNQAEQVIGLEVGASAYEIEVTDPRDGSRGWAYVSADTNRAASPGEDYVRYRPAESILEGSRYRIRLSKENPLVYEQLILKGDTPETGQRELNIVDRFKMRGKASLLLPLFRFRRNESDLRSRTVGWIDGPVRVVRRMETQVDLLWGFTTPVQVQDTIFYPDHFLFWVDLTSPIALNRLVSKAEVRLSADLNAQAVGMLFASQGNPAGLVVDGVMSEQERHMETQGQDWYALSDGIDTLFSRLVIPQGAPVGMELEYMDDRRLPDPPETVLGRWGDAGYRLTGLASVGKGRYRVMLHSMIGEGYRVGGEKAFLDIRDQPLIWRCRLLPDRPVSGLDPLAAVGSGRSVVRKIDEEGNVDER
jgi:hypothetical protein